MEAAFMRFFSHESEEKSKEAFSLAYGTINILAFFSTVIIILNSTALAEMSGYSHIPEAGNLIILAALIPFLDALSNIPFNYLRMTRRAVKLSAIKFLVIIVSLILHFVLLSRYNFQAEGALIAQITANAISFLVLIPIILQNLVFSIDKKILSDMFRFALPTIPAGLATVFLQVADKPLLKMLTNSELDITTYQVNYRLGIPMLIFVSIFDFAWQPFYLKHFKEAGSGILFGRVLTYYTLIAGIIFLAISLFTEYIVMLPFPGGTLINSIYWQGLSILPLIVLAYFFYGLYVNFSIGVIIGKKPYKTAIALGVGVVINIISNIILVPEYGYTGAAYSIILAYFSAMIIIYFFSRKYFTVQYEWKRILLIVGIVTLLYFSIDFVENFISGKTQLILLKISAILMLLLLLKIFGFFTSGETDFIKKFFTKKNTD